MGLHGLKRGACGLLIGLVTDRHIHTAGARRCSGRRVTSHNNAQHYGRILGCILFYSRSPQARWYGDAVRRQKDIAALQKAYSRSDTRGHCQPRQSYGARFQPGHSGTVWRGYDITARGRCWSASLKGHCAHWIKKHIIPGRRDLKDALDTAV